MDDFVQLFADAFANIILLTVGSVAMAAILMIFFPKRTNLIMCLTGACAGTGLGYLEHVPVVFLPAGFIAGAAMLFFIFVAGPPAAGTPEHPTDPE